MVMHPHLVMTAVAKSINDDLTIIGSAITTARERNDVEQLEATRVSLNRIALVTQGMLRYAVQLRQEQSKQPVKDQTPLSVRQ